MKKVSVIIPVFQAEPWLAKAIDSCLDQKESILEIIVVDDFSTDRSLEIAEGYQQRFPGLVKSVLNLKKGSNPARAYGYSLSSGEFIQWLDADDVLLPGKLDAQANYLDQHPEFDIAYSDWQLDTYDSNEKIQGSELKKAGFYKDYLLELLKDNWLPPHAYLVRRNIAQQRIPANWWNPETAIAQDREYFTLAAIEGANFGYLPGNYCIYNRYLKRKSLSRSLKLSNRAGHLVTMFYRFIEAIENQDRISRSAKKKYRQVLLTQVLYQAAVYKVPVNSKDFSIFETKWNLIRGTRSKLKMLKSLIVQA